MPNNQQLHDNLYRLLRPRHIAYIGGSQVEGPIEASRNAGFDGEIRVVNPVRDRVAGLQTFSRIEDLPEAPDAALIALSPERSIEAVAALASIGAAGAVCMAAGFAELGAPGSCLQQQLREAAGDLALIGPNCMGVLNLFDGAAIWGASGHVEAPGAGGAAIISQSGAFLYGITNVEQGFPLGYAISTGNQAVVDMADCIEALLFDERVRAIGLYLEGLSDGAALGRACWHALQKGIPIIALKGGDTAEAERVAKSHTSAMVVERDLWMAFSERYGIVEVSTPKAMVESLKLLTIGGMPRGNKLSAITFSGGLNSLIAAQAPAHGLELPQPRPKNAERMRSQLPEIVPVANPLDLNLPWLSKTGMSLRDGDRIADCLTDFADGVADLATLFVDVPRPDDIGSDKDWYPSMQAMAKVAENLGIPVAVASILPEGLYPALRKHLLAHGIAPLLGFSDTLEALAVATRLGEKHRRMQTATAPGDLLTRLGPDASGAPSILLDEAEAKAALAAHGLVTPAFTVSSREQLAEAATKIGLPLALKLVSSEIPHKAGMGGVHLGLGSMDAVEAAAQAIDNAAIDYHGKPTERFLVEAMIEAPVAEYIIGIKQQSALGLALMIGRGGVDVEKLNRRATVLLPLVERDLEKGLQSIGFAADTPGYEAMRDAVRVVAAYAIENRERLRSLDINPLIINAGGAAIAADALIEMSTE
jgi:acyl-CoA synthetase (NDP forming)